MVMAGGLLLGLSLIARIGNAGGDATGVVQDQGQSHQRANLRDANRKSAPHLIFSLAQSV
jgi:hypothetical protein